MNRYDLTAHETMGSAENGRWVRYADVEPVIKQNEIFIEVLRVIAKEEMCYACARERPATSALLHADIPLEESGKESIKRGLAQDGTIDRGSFAEYTDQTIKTSEETRQALEPLVKALRDIGQETKPLHFRSVPEYAQAVLRHASIPLEEPEDYRTASGEEQAAQAKAAAELSADGMVTETYPKMQPEAYDDPPDPALDAEQMARIRQPNDTDRIIEALALAYEGSGYIESRLEQTSRIRALKRGTA